MHTACSDRHRYRPWRLALTSHLLLHGSSWRCARGSSHAAQVENLVETNFIRLILHLERMINAESGLRRAFLVASRLSPCSSHPTARATACDWTVGTLPKRSRRSDAFRPSPLLTLQLFPTRNQRVKILTAVRDFALLACCLLCACRARSAASERIQPRSDAMTIARPRRRHGCTARGRGCGPCGSASEVDAGWISHGLGLQNGPNSSH